MLLVWVRCLRYAQAGKLYGGKTTPSEFAVKQLLPVETRYLRMNPEIRKPMDGTEKRVAAMPIYHVPKQKVAAIEPKLQDGDVIGIATKYHGGYCSHVGLISRSDYGDARFMLASRDHRKVVIDKSISGYLNKYSKQAGAIIGRPLEASEAVTDPTLYQANLRKMIG